MLDSMPNRGKFDPRAFEGIILGYSTTSKAYRFYNPDKNRVEESINITFNESDIDLDRDEEVFADSSPQSQMGQSHSEKGAFHLASPLPHSSQATPEQNSTP